MKKIIVGIATLSSILAGCGQYKSPVSDYTIGNRIPFEFQTPPTPPPALAQTPKPPKMGDDFHPDRSYWYPSYGPFPLCHGCESIYAYVANNTDRTQRIGLAVYKRFADGSKILYSREYALIQQNADPSNNNWQQILVINGSPLDCPFEVYLTQINVNFDPFVPNVDTDGYLIATYSGNNNLSCNN